MGLKFKPRKPFSKTVIGQTIRQINGNKKMLSDIKKEKLDALSYWDRKRLNRFNVQHELEWLDKNT